MTGPEVYKDAIDIGLEISGRRDLDHPYRWTYVYMDGEIEFCNPNERDAAPDIFFMNQFKPKGAGVYKATLYEWYQDEKFERKVIIKLDMHDGVLGGRGCYIYDHEALQYVMNPDKWG